MTMQTMTRGWTMRATAMACALTLLAGCAGVTRAPHTDARAALAMPAAYDEATPTVDQTMSQQWWQAFGSATLDDLVRQAEGGSLDLRVAAERVTQAEASLQVAGASLLPAASLGGTTRRTRTQSDAGGATTGASSASLSVSYEVDLWGRLAAGRDAASATLQATRFDLDATRLSLQAAVATTYLQWLAYEERAAIARENLASAERILRIVEARQRNGVATPLDVSQQRAAVLSARTAIGPLALAARQSLSALALLLGRVPQGFTLPAVRLDIVQVPAVAAGLPSTLLTRRPDLAAAESRLAAADANITAARAALLPTLSLTATGGLASTALLSLANPVSSVALAGTVAQAVFDGGARRAQVRLSESQQRVLLDTYRTTVLSALKEVDDGLGNAALNAQQWQTQQALVEQATRSLQLAEVRLREGVGDLLTVLNAQSTLYAARDNLAQSQLARLSAAIDLYKALGGGWQAG